MELGLVSSNAQVDCESNLAFLSEVVLSLDVGDLLGFGVSIRTGLRPLKMVLL